MWTEFLYSAQYAECPKLLASSQFCSWALEAIESSLTKSLNGLTEVLDFILFLRIPRYRLSGLASAPISGSLLTQYVSCGSGPTNNSTPETSARQAISRIVNPKGENTHLARIRFFEKSPKRVTDELRANFNLRPSSCPNVPVEARKR